MSGTAVTGTSYLRFENTGDLDRLLILLPHAGAGAASFTRWLGVIPEELTPVRLQLPGREDLAAEPAFHSLSEAVAAIMPEISRLGNIRLQLYGHSMGALIAYELARALSAVGLAPEHLFLSGRRAPHLPSRRPPIHLLPEESFATALARWGVGPIGGAAVRRYAIPIIRNDLRLCEEHNHVPGPPLPFPITVFHGCDDPIVDVDEARAWKVHTSSTYTFQLLPGDHFFHQRRRGAIATAIAASR